MEGYNKDSIFKILDETAKVLVKNGYISLPMNIVREYVEWQDQRIKELEAREM